MRGQAGGVLAAAGRGDEHALGLLWREVNPALIRYLRVQAADHAEELAAATWVVLSRDLVNFGGDDHAWRVHVFTVARRQLVAWQRDKGQRELTVAETIRRHVTPPTRTVEAAITDVAIDVLASLPDQQAEALVLRTAAHLPVRDVARVMKLSEAKAEAAIHAAAAGAAAIAASTQHRRAVDRGRQAHVVHPDDGPAHIAGLTGDDAAIESLLAGQPIGLGAPPPLRLVADMLAALAAPPLDNELTGVGPALVSFRAQFAARPPRYHRPRRLAPRVAGSLVAASVAIGATLVGAYTAVLPEPLQQLAHDWLSAPAPHPTRHGTGKNTGDTTVPSPRSTAGTKRSADVGAITSTSPGRSSARASAGGATPSATPGVVPPPENSGTAAQPTSAPPSGSSAAAPSGSVPVPSGSPSSHLPSASRSPTRGRPSSTRSPGGPATPPRGGKKSP